MHSQDAATLWSGDSSGDVELTHAYGFGCSSPGPIPCMAGELLQHILANEQLQLGQSWCACCALVPATEMHACAPHMSMHTRHAGL